MCAIPLRLWKKFLLVDDPLREIGIKTIRTSKTKINKKKRSHGDILYQKLQKKDIDAVLIKRALESFTSSVQTTR